ncbi:hypothetical protein GCM10009678_32750 [Actinomadura kijaniata]
MRGEHVACVQVRLSPLVAGAVLGASPAEPEHAVVTLDVWGRDAERIGRRLADAPSWRDRFAITEVSLARRTVPATGPGASPGSDRDRGLAVWSRRLLGMGGSPGVPGSRGERDRGKGDVASQPAMRRVKVDVRSVIMNQGWVAITLFSAAILVTVTFAVRMIKAEVAGLCGETAASVEGLRAGTGAACEGLRAEMRAGLGGLRAELHAGTDGLRREMQAEAEGQRRETQGHVDRLRGQVRADVAALRGHVQGATEVLREQIGVNAQAHREQVQSSSEWLRGRVDDTAESLRAEMCGRLDALRDEITARLAEIGERAETLDREGSAPSIRVMERPSRS